MTALLSAPSFAGPVEAIRIESPTAIASAPGASAGAVLTAPSLVAPSLSAAIAPSPVLAPSLAAAAPNAAPAPAAAGQSSELPAAFAPAPPAGLEAVHDARGPPAALAPRTSAGVAARVVDTVRGWGAPIEDIFTTHDVLLVGENHGSLDSVNTLTREMPRLAAAGVKAVGIEGLKRPDQQRVDAYVSGKTDEVPVDALKFSPRRVAVFRALLKSARENGVRIVALGIPLDQVAAMAATLASLNTGRPIGEFAGSAGELIDRAQNGYEEGYNEAVAEVYLTRRNKAMANFILEAISTGGKAVVLIGQAHVEGLDLIPGKLMNAPGQWGTLASELSGLAVRAFSLTQTGGIFVDADAAVMDKQARPLSYQAAAGVAPNGRASYQPLGPDKGLWHAGGRTPVSVH